MVILSQNGDHQRAVPIQAVQTEGDSTLLHCSRPGFEYHRQQEVLKETVTPFQTVEGKASITLPGRTWLQSSGSDWQVRTTEQVRIGTSRIERTGDWVTVGERRAGA